jgi:hypothetical protein
LVADLEAVAMGPVDPPLEVLEVQGAEGVAVIGLEAGERLPVHRGNGRGVAGGEGGGVGLEIVAVARAEDRRQACRPAGVEVFERIVELAADEVAREGREGAFERR